MPNDICFNCMTPMKDCEWITNGVPVPGWTARKKRSKLGDTYTICACPNYKAPRFAPLKNGRFVVRVKIGYCEVCGRAFNQNVGSGRRKVYCSATCRAIAHIRRREI